MATIQPIEGGSVHRIQSGQVIVDLCSVVKELVENSLDADATSLDIRFKNHGLDSIEVQDNGSGVSKENYESIALKHYTSKLRSYEDLTTLNTFGFRGEAISSLCALSDVHILTATENEAPKGSKLVFESSGKLKSVQTVAAQRGTTVAVETIFKNLPVRRQELVKNIKREYGKVLSLLQAYACISTGVKVSVSNVLNKKKTVVFSTKANKTTRENIANVFGAKTLSALVPLDLSFELQPTNRTSNEDEKNVKVLGHVSKPVVGEGRQTPDRQMFFVNARPCALPQVARVINEVYKSYNLSQSPFIFANVVLDTNAYDVNVSPDKRTILLHDQGPLLDSIKETLVELFDNQQQTVPQSQHGAVKLPTQTSLNLTRQPSRSSSRIDDPARTDVIQEPNANCEDNSAAPTESSPLTMSSIYRSSPTAAPTSGNRIVRQEEPEHETLSDVDEDDDAGFQGGLISQLFHSKVQTRPSERVSKETSEGLSVGKQKLVGKLVRQREFLEHENNTAIDEYDDVRESNATQFIPQGKDRHVHDFNQRLLSQRQKQARDSNTSDSPFRSPSPDGDIPSIGSAHAKNLPGVVPNAFDRMRPMRTPKQTATITVGSKTTTSTIGSDALRYTHSPRSSRIRAKVWPATGSTATGFQSALRAFAAPGTQMSDASGNDDYDDEDDEEPVVRSTRASTWGKSPSEQRTQESRSETEHSPPQSVVLEDVEDEDDIGEQTKPQTEEEDSDEEYLDEESKKKMEDERVARLIAEAEQKASRPTDDGLKRTQNLLRGGHKDATTRLMQTIDVSLQGIKKQSAELRTAMQELGELHTTEGDDGETADAEERLSLTVSKADFARMHVAGQFNLGFIIAVRPDKNNEDELFIIDQHASDEKYNFERLQATTTVQHQRLVQPQILDLTAIEEELILDNQPALLRNGFVVTVDDSGESPVGRRCQLTSLPMSREVTFSSRDLEELLVLLADAKDARPSKVRKMFAMRACRSSVMVGKTLAARQMKRLVTNMGTIDKPWNCPHGRPTMRHLYGLGSWQSWEEGMGVAGLEREQGQGEVPWEAWLATQEEHSEDDSSHGQIQASAEL